MSQRDTITPLCKIMYCGSGTVTEIPLVNSAVRVTAPITFVSATKSFTDAGDPTDVGTCAVLAYPATYNYTVSCSQASYTTASATFKITTTRQQDGNITLDDPVLILGGAYSADAAGAILGVSGNGSDGHMGTPSGVFALTSRSPVLAQVPYVTVTDLSGTEGWFRVWPGSGTGVYASATAVSALEGYGLSADSDRTNVWNPGAAGVPEVDTSGYPGVIGAAGTTVTLTLQPHQKINSIHLESHVDSPPYGSQNYAQYAISYGVIKNANPLRDQNLPDIV